MLPAVVAPRRADTIAVIGAAALLADARGTGYRRIARPAAAAAVHRAALDLRRAATRPDRVAAHPGAGMARPRRPRCDQQPHAAGQAGWVTRTLTALAATALTLRARVIPHVPPWTLIGQITHGRLVGPPAPARPS